MNKVTRYDPFSQLSALQQQFFGDDWVAPFKTDNIPTTDVFTQGDKMIVQAHLPNFDRDDIDIQIDDDYLTIQAERHEKEEDKGKKYLVRESSSSFYRRIFLPNRANSKNVDADLKDGMLKVTIPLTPLPEPKKVAIKSQLPAETSKAKKK